MKCKVISQLFIIFAICNVSTVFSSENLIDVQFNATAKEWNLCNKGTFSGPLPTGVMPDFPAWNNSVVNTEIKDDNEEQYQRFSVTKHDSAVLFRLSTKKVVSPGYYIISLRYRNAQNPLNLHVRQMETPYKNFWEMDLPLSSEWTEQSLPVHVESPNRILKKTKRDDSNLVLYLSLESGVTDLSYITLKIISKNEYISMVSENIERPSQGEINYINNSRFPLGIPSGWNINRENLLGLVESDPDNPGPSGVASLKISSAEPIRVYSAPFQTAYPDQPVQVSLKYKSDGEWSAQCGGEKKQLSPSPIWEKTSFSFIPDPIAKGFNIVFSGKGNLYLDSLMAYTGEVNSNYRSAGECEIALASGESDSEAKGVQFSDEVANVKYYASGSLEGQILKAAIVNIYGDRFILNEIDLSKSAQGVLNYDVFPYRDLGVFRVEVWAEKNGQRTSPYNEIIMNRVRRPIYWGKDAPNSPFGGHFFAQKRVLKTMKAGGINWIRLHDCCGEANYWGYLEPKEGQWFFEDDKIKRYRDETLKILGCIGTAPEWASFFNGQKHHHDIFNKMYQPKEIDEFKNYVRILVSRYKGIIDEYQFQNEPWSSVFWHKSYNAETEEFSQGDTPAIDYVSLAKVAYDEMKMVYPEAILYGFNSTNTNKGFAWTKELYDFGGYNYCDMIDYHYYNNDAQLNCFPNDLVSQSYQQAIGYINNNVQKSIKPVVLSETNPGRSGSVQDALKRSETLAFTGLLKYSIPWKEDEQSITFADIYCRFIIANLRLGLKRIFLYSDHCYHNLLRSPSFPVLLGADGHPYPTYSAFSNLAWLLEDHTFIKSEKIGEDVWAFVFAKSGNNVVVISGMKNGIYAAPVNDQLEYIDLFGNPITDQAKYNGKIFYAISAIEVDELIRLLKAD